MRRSCAKTPPEDAVVQYPELERVTDVCAIHKIRLQAPRKRFIGRCDQERRQFSDGDTPDHQLHPGILPGSPEKIQQERPDYRDHESGDPREYDDASEGSASRCLV